MSGIFAVYHRDQEDAFEDIYFGLYALQHRGQETVGIATRQQTTRIKIGQNLVKDNFDLRDGDFLAGTMGIGFIENNLHSIEMPIVLDDAILTIDGLITNEGFTLLDLLNHLRQGGSACINYLQSLQGGFAICYMDHKGIIAMRDQKGIKPLTLGQRGTSTYVSSESCSIEAVGGEVLRDLAPGEIIAVTSDKTHIYPSADSPKVANVCAFEYIYFAREDSVMDGVSVYQARYAMGEETAREESHNFEEPTIVIGAPDSGLVAAMGYAHRAGIPYQQGFVRNHYVGRTFSRSGADTRKRDVKIKLTPIRANLEGKHVILVDDSIIRGTTIHQTVQDLRQAGAKSVHVRIASPPVINRSSRESGSISVPEREDLIAYRYSVEEIRKIIGSDSLAYLSLPGLKKACQNDQLYDPYFKENH